jgi:hypothetical protein
MADNDQKSIEIGLKLSAADAQQVEGMLKRLATTANSLADAFSRISAAGTSTGSLSTGGVANAGAIAATASAPAGSGPQGTFSNIVRNTVELNKAFAAATPSIKNFQQAYGSLMETLSKPLPDGAASVLDAIKAIGGGTAGHVGAGAGVATHTAATPAAGGTGGPPPPTPEATPPSEGGPERPSGGRRRGGLSELVDVDLLERKQQNLTKTMNNIIDVARLDTSMNFSRLQNQASFVALDRTLTQSTLSGDFTKRMALSQMGGAAAAREAYGSTGVDTAAGYGKVAAGLGAAALGLSLFTGGASLPILGGASLAVGSLGTVSAGALAGTAAMAGGVATIAGAGADLYNNGPEARTEAAVLRAISEYADTDEFSPFIREMGAQSPHLLRTSRRLNKLFGGAPSLGETGPSRYMQIRDLAYRSDMDLDQGVQIAGSLAGRMSMQRGGTDVLRSLFSLNRAGHSADELMDPLATVAGRISRTGGSIAGLGEKAVSTAESVLGEGGEFMAPSLLGAATQLSKTRFGMGGELGLGTTMAMLGGGVRDQEQLMVRTQAFQQMQSGATDTLPYMVKLQRINQQFGDLPPQKRMLLAQMGPADLANVNKLMSVLGVSREKAMEIQKTLAPIETELRFGRLLDPKSEMAKLAKSKGGLYQALTDKETTTEQRAELIKEAAASRMAFTKEGTLEGFEEELKMRVTEPRGLGVSADVGERGDKPFVEASKQMAGVQLTGERVAFNRLASEMAKILQNAGMSMNALLSAGQSNPTKVVPKPAPQFQVGRRGL